MHNRTVAMAIAGVITSDDGVSRRVDEDELYQREREGFIELARSAESRAAIESVLGIG